MVEMDRTSPGNEEPFAMTAAITSISTRLGRRVGLDEPMSHLPVHEPARDERAISGPVGVYASFVVSPGDADLWIQTWMRLAKVADTWPGCRSFRLLRDRNDPMFVAAISEWENMDAYASFTHGTQSMALQLAMSRVCVPGEARFLDILPTDASMTTAG
jgi:heme-degrading monooxygenase HmoA